MSTFINLKNKASVLLVSIMALQITTACLLVKIESFKNQVKICQQVKNNYQNKINEILK